VKLRVFTFLVVGHFLLAGCMNINDYREERVAKADRAFKKIRNLKFPENAVLSLPFCIELALKNNLDLKVYELREAVDKEKKTAAALGMLPDLIITNDVTQRNNEPGAKSINLTGTNAGSESLAYSKSTQPFENRVRAELIFSAIDFGLAFCNYIQQDDRAILTVEQKRRAAQNLILDVTRSYLRVAAAQYAMEETEKMIALSVETEELLQKMAKNKTVPLVRVLEENKKFIVLKKALMEYKRSYQNSCIELRSLMGYYPTSEVRVDTSAMNKLVELNIPDIELLEEAALIERPELYQIDIQKHITLMEARKALITMFPNVQVFMDFTNSTNPFLYKYSWWEVGARTAYNLLKLPQKIEHYYALDAEEEQLKAQALALSVGILAQVRIAHANLVEVKERYELAEDLFEVYEKHEHIAEIQSKSAGSLSKVELSRIKIEAAQRSIERTQALGNYYLSYFRLLNAVGLESLDKTELEKLKKRIEKSINETIEDELDDAAKYKTEIAEIQKNIDKYNETIKNLQLKINYSEEEVKVAETSRGELNEGYELGHKSSLNKYDTKRKIFEQIIVDSNRSIAGLKEELNKTKSEYAIHKKQIQNYNNEIEKLEDSIDNLKDELDDYSDRLKDTEYYMSKAQLLADKIPGTNRLISENSDKASSLKDDIKNTDKEHVKNLNNQLAALEKKIWYWKRDMKKYDSAADEYSTYKEKADSLSTSIDKVNNLISSSTGKLSDLKINVKNMVVAEEADYLKIKNYNMEIEKAEEKIKIADNSVNELKEGYQDGKDNRLDNYNDNNEEFASVSAEGNDKIAEYNEEIKNYHLKIQNYEDEKNIVFKDANGCQSSINEHNKRLDKYDEAIEQLKRKNDNNMMKRKNPLLKHYDKVMGLQNEKQPLSSQQPVIMPHGVEPEVGEETLGGQAAQSISNLNMEMQQSFKGNTVSPEEYTPGRANNIIVEAQKDAANNKIDQEALDPMTQDNITLQTLKDTGNNLISGEEYNVNQMNQENLLSNEVQNQMTRSMVQPGRDGN